MAIKIPSGNIFENNYTPIKNNTIKTVEIPVKVVSTAYEQDTTVYSTRDNINADELPITVENNENKDEQVWGYNSGHSYYWERITNEVYIRKKEITINSFTIPKVGNNAKITKLTDNKIKIDFNTKVDYYENVYDYTSTGDVSGEPTKSTTQNGLYVENVDKVFTSYGKLGNNQYGNEQSAKVKSRVQVTNKTNESTIDFNVTSEGSFGDGSNTATTIIQPFSSSISFYLGSGEIAVREENDYYTVPTFTAICGYSARVRYGWDESNAVTYPDETPSVWNKKDMRVTRYDITPISININLNGNTISIDLKDNIQTYGDTTNRKNSYKADGNELIQSSNTHNGTSAVDMFAQKVLTQYANGKETVELQCSINDYFDENGELAISTKQYKENYNTSITFVGMQPFQRKYMITFKGYIEHTAYAIRYQNEQANVEKDKDLNFIVVDENSIFYKVFRENYPIMVTVLCKKLNRLFAIGDEVIPYIYTAYGERPLSTHKNGTPKVFKVVGKKFIDEGIVWQKLTLQEK